MISNDRHFGDNICRILDNCKILLQFLACYPSLQISINEKSVQSHPLQDVRCPVRMAGI